MTQSLLPYQYEYDSLPDFSLGQLASRNTLHFLYNLTAPE